MGSEELVPSAGVGGALQRDVIWRQSHLAVTRVGARQWSPRSTSGIILREINSRLLKEELRLHIRQSRRRHRSDCHNRGSQFRSGCAGDTGRSRCRHCRSLNHYLVEDFCIARNFVVGYIQRDGELLDNHTT